MTTATLVKFNAAKNALAQARSVDEVKQVRDKAAALRLYARQQYESRQMQNDIAEIKLRAERRLGELLAEREKAKGGQPYQQKPTGDIVSPVEPPPTLSDLGINKKQSSRWQQAAKVPEETFEQHVATVKALPEGELTSAGIRRLAKQLRRQRSADAQAAPSAGVIPGEIQLVVGDFAEVAQTIELGSISLIITDPPYPHQFLHLYGLLAEQAERLLEPGGSLLAMAGQSYLPAVLEQMTPHLNYHWTFAYLTPGGQSPQIWPRKVNAFWKPVLWFVRGEYDGGWQGDVIKSKVNDNDKRFHEWGQSESGIGRLVSKFPSSGLVLDPFVGGGTTAIVCHRLGRPFLGIDISPEAIETTRNRLLAEEGR